jgi:hypothetical protein
MQSKVSDAVGRSTAKLFLKDKDIPAPTRGDPYVQEYQQYIQQLQGDARSAFDLYVMEKAPALAHNLGIDKKFEAEKAAKEAALVSAARLPELEKVLPQLEKLFGLASPVTGAKIRPYTGSADFDIELTMPQMPVHYVQGEFEGGYVPTDAFRARFNEVAELAMDMLPAWAKEERQPGGLNPKRVVQFVGVTQDGRERIRGGEAPYMPS